MSVKGGEGYPPPGKVSCPGPLGASSLILDIYLSMTIFYVTTMFHPLSPPLWVFSLSLNLYMSHTSEHPPLPSHICFSSTVWKFIHGLLLLLCSLPYPSVPLIFSDSLTKVYLAKCIFIYPLNLRAQAPFAAWLLVILWSCALGDRFSYDCWSDAEWVVQQADVVGQPEESYFLLLDCLVMVQCGVWSELQLCTSGRLKHTYPAFLASVKLGWQNNVCCLTQFSVDSTLFLIWAFWALRVFLWWLLSTDAAVLFCKAQNYACVLCSCPPMTCWPV